MLELLSPAGSPEAVVAAVQNGADAIYLGLGGFNARRGAKNFTHDEFLKTAEYCRVRGCRLYVTLNTLASDRELERAARLARFVHEAGADAVLVQDLGVARVLRSVCPELTLHASTQMSIHNLAGAYAAAELGMKRVVLARELSFEQIKFIASRSPVEIEVFVHGALCFSHSGQCYMSSLIGRRSGNRGMCAQPCRMEYSMGRRMDGYPMSLKDSCLVSHLRELADAGVVCAKIEGRMRRPEYTAVATQIYARAIHDGVAPTDDELERLEQIFSRQGFTDGYFTGVKENMHGVHTEPEREINKLYAEVRRGYSGPEARRVDVDFYVVARSGEPVSLLVQDTDGNRAVERGPVPESAQRTELTGKSVSDQMYKTGGTPYRCREVRAAVEPGLFLTAAALNDLRRHALEQLSKKRAAAPERKAGSFPRMPADRASKRRPVVNMQVLSAEQLTPELAALEPDTLYVPLRLLCESFEAVAPFTEKKTKIAAVLPRVITDTESDAVRYMLDRVRERGVKYALAGNLGHIALARQCGFEIRGDFGLNVFNSYTLETLQRAGLVSATASFELRLAQIRDLAKSLDTELIAYGRLPLMVTDQCVIKQAAGGCACQSPASMSDRMGSVFPVMKEFGCRNVIYNAHKLFLADKMDELSSSGLWALRLCFTLESPRECVQVSRSYLEQTKYSPNGLTRGLYYRGVE